MSTERLTGELIGANRAEIIAKATRSAETYFGTPCVAVRLNDEHPHPVLSHFVAKFEAREHHAIRTRTYGPDRCRDCGRDSWPHAPLPRWREE